MSGLSRDYCETAAHTHTKILTFLCDVFKLPFDGVEVGVYADDIRISTAGDTVQDAARQLTADLDNVHALGLKNRVRFDTESEKCGYFVFSRQQQPGATIRFGGTPLGQKLNYKCLGVAIDAGRRFSEHIQ